jgi:glycosyltransferase involved in cell wall biosynthesis
MYHADLLGGLSARLAGVPVFWGLRNGNLDPEQSRHLTLRVARLNACLSRWLPTRIVSCSVRAVEIHRALGYADKFVVIPNGLDLARFTPVDVARRGTVRHVLGLPEGLKVIGHLGRPDPQKDHATLLKVFARVAAQRKDVCLLLAGLDLEHGSPYLDGLLARTKTSGLE